MRLIDADALNGYKLGLISPYAQNLFHKIINEAPTIIPEPCGDAISRKAVEKITWAETISRDWLNVLTEVREKVRALPPVQPKQRTGRWMNNQNGTYTCDGCGCKHSKSNYCPNCGAKMQEVEE